MEFSPKNFEKAPTILFSAGQLERSSGKKNLNILKKPCFQNFNLIYCVPIFISLDQIAPLNSIALL